MLNLDTHILLHALAGELSARETKILSASTWGISAIVLWEINKLHQLGRIEVDIRNPQFVAAVHSMTIWPIDWRVCEASVGLDFRSDPADELIAATSIVYSAPLVTRDKRIKASKMVKLA